MYNESITLSNVIIEIMKWLIKTKRLANNICFILNLLSGFACNKRGSPSCITFLRTKAGNMRFLEKHRGRVYSVL